MCIKIKYTNFLLFPIQMYEDRGDNCSSAYGTNQISVWLEMQFVNGDDDSP